MWLVGPMHCSRHALDDLLQHVADTEAAEFLAVDISGKLFLGTDLLHDGSQTRVEELWREEVLGSRCRCHGGHCVEHAV
ncbi:hypothetical protein ColKHC_05084 [Colletotrichum higginsianum]|nr:hypothetical protein ColKHC_05084 [Colletotrichum higginsianum]